MGTITTKIGNIFAGIKDTYHKLGEYDVEDVDINSFDSLKTSNISQKDYAELKKSIAEVDSMAKSYYVSIDNKKRQNKKSISDVSNTKQDGKKDNNKVKAYKDREKERED